MMTEKQVLKILFVEDRPEDLEIAKRIIKNAGILFESHLVDTEEEFLIGLHEFKPDIIIADYLLPDFDGMRALEITQTYDDTIPFIILTGAANEEIIVDAMKAGANDYLLKDRSNRLPFAIQEAIKKRDVLLKEKCATESLEFYSKIVEQSPNSVISTNMEGIITSWNKGAEKIFGYSSGEVLGKHISLVYHDEDHHILENEVIKPLQSNGYNHRLERMKRKNGESFIGSLSLWTIKDRRGNHIGMVGYTLDITKRVKAEEELQIKNQAIEHNVNGIIIMDLKGIITYSNKAALEMWGYEDVIGKKIEDFWNGEQEENEILEYLMNQGIKKDLFAKRKDGSLFPVLLSTTTIKNSSDKAIGFMASLVDISKQKEAENALRKSEERYRLLAENTLDCIWTMDMNLVFTYANPTIYDILGFTPQEWIGSKLNDHCDEENFNIMMKHIMEGVKNVENFQGAVFQVEVLNKNGDKVPVEIIGKVITENGKPVLMQGTTRDITYRILAEKALKESEKQLKLAMKVSEHGYWDWDLEKGEFYFSPKSYAMLGYKEQEFPMSIKKWGEMMHPEDRKNIMPGIIRSVKEGKNFRYELRIQSKSGEYRWIFARGDTFRSDKKNRRAIGTLVDVTERKKAEEQMMLTKIAAEEANRCKNELLANMNHELRTPLNSVIGYTEVLIDDKRDNLTEEQRRYLQIVNNSGYELLGLVNNVLDLAQIESDGLGLEFTKFDPEIAIKKVMKHVKRLTAKKKMEINVEIDKDITEITADANKFREVLYNLIENALKFTPENGTINVVAGIKGEEIEVSVEDTGIGIEKKDRERIFDPFVQVDGSTTRRYGGAGLGLVLVKEYLKLQNGNIWVDSEPGKGSKFTFRLPVYPVGRGNNI